MKKNRAIFERNCSNYSTYDNEENANLINERFYMEKKLCGIRLYRKVYNQDSNVLDRRFSKKRVGFGKNKPQ